MSRLIYTKGLIAVILLLAGCTTTDHAPPPEVVQIEDVVPYHTVHEGDTVGSVASQYNMTRSDLIRLNRLEPPYRLYEGQKLVINITVNKSAETESVQLLPDTNAVVANPQEPPLLPTPEGPDVIVPPQQDFIPKTPDFAYVWPIEKGRERIAQKFNDSDGYVIIHAPAGTAVRAAADGVVMLACVPGGAAAVFGQTVAIKHPTLKTMTIYAHLQKIDVKVGDKIKQGAIIGKVGSSGTDVSRPQLYFELNNLANGRTAVDPEKFLP
jgi:murein DD-endopeptidase MepM/ murein hydrolase activator NlpD